MQLIPPELFTFLEDLTEHNDRDWFRENKVRYEQAVRQPCLALIASLAPHLSAISPTIQATPRSLFRIYRDTRFSRDKTPYKTHAAIHFRHEQSRDVHTPGFYVHLGVEACWFGAGIWRPDSPTVRRIRQRIDEHPSSWLQLRQQLQETGLQWTGEQLKRAPRGYQVTHPLIEELRFKDFTVMKSLGHDEVLGSDFVGRVAGLCAESAPLLADLANTLDLRW